MNKLKIKTNKDVESVFEKYPESVREKLLKLRKLILDAAEETNGISNIEETLKWGEPSYLTDKGSTVRIDWKPKTPDQYAVYFKCTSKLVPSFITVFNDLFNYEGTRAIVFKMEDSIPETELKKCISAALVYHKIKHLPLLGLE